MATKKNIHVVCPDWVLESTKRCKSLEVRPYHPKYVVNSTADGAGDASENGNGADKKPPSAPSTTILKKFKQSQRVTEELKAMQAKVSGNCGISRVPSTLHCSPICAWKKSEFVSTRNSRMY